MGPRLSVLRAGGNPEDRKRKIDVDKTKTGANSGTPLLADARKKVPKPKKPKEKKTGQQTPRDASFELTVQNRSSGKKKLPSRRWRGKEKG